MSTGEPRSRTPVTADELSLNLESAPEVLVEDFVDIVGTERVEIVGDRRPKRFQVLLVDLEGTEGTLEIEYICGLCNAE